MALRSQETELVADESLEKWKLIGSGGFGNVYKARHKDWGFDVAIKLIRHAEGTQLFSLWDEANHMGKASCEFVLRVYGIYQGCPPDAGMCTQQGIVMEFMERGSIQTLQNDLPGPPPSQLAFRLAHQVALGMNFLHSRNLMHHDLKPSNVLLNGDLNAKLADFGLSRVSTSALSSNGKMAGVLGGSYKYMPPEAFDPSYKPVRAFDRYSYGILLWSIVTGKEPYPAADVALVALRIPLGDRPPCEEIDQMRAKGLTELVDLMKRCWDENPSTRPIFKECLEVTEAVLAQHMRELPGAVHQVLTRLEPITSGQPPKMPLGFTPQTPEQPKSHDTVDLSRFTVQQGSVSASPKTLTDTEKVTFVDANRAVIIQEVGEVLAIAEELGDRVHGETYSVIKAKETSQGKMRALYDGTLRSGGAKVKVAFYDALKKHQPTLVERLGG